MGYGELLKNPKWQRKRLEILQRDEWKCQECSSEYTELHVHHIEYKDFLLPWQYNDSDLITLCKKCHSKKHTQKKIPISIVELIESRVSNNENYAEIKFNYDNELAKIEDQISKNKTNDKELFILMDQRIKVQRKLIEDLCL